MHICPRSLLEAVLKIIPCLRAAIRGPPAARSDDSGRHHVAQDVDRSVADVDQAIDPTDDRRHLQREMEGCTNSRTLT